VLIRDASSSYLSKAAAAPDKQVEAVQLTAKAFPNPSNTHFTIKTQGQAGEKINVRIMDALGRIVETKSNVPVNGSLVLGHSYRPGMYYAEIVQGSQKVTLKLVKQ
jgi:2'-5' RNA ligase